MTHRYETGKSSIADILVDIDDNDLDPKYIVREHGVSTLRTILNQGWATVPKNKGYLVLTEKAHNMLRERAFNLAQERRRSQPRQQVKQSWFQRFKKKFSR